MNSLIETFHVDVRIIIAQIINFGIVFFVLYYFILKPILKVMKERSEKIQDGLKFSEQIEKDMKEIQEKKERILSETRKSADFEMENAKKIAEDKKREIISDAQQKAQEVLMFAKVSGEDERHRIMDKSKQDVLDLAFAVAAKVLSKKIGDKEDKDLTGKFIKNL